MPRVRKGAARRRKHKRILKAARGYIGAASRRYRIAREARLRADQHATVGRKLRKRDFRRLWITHISAACRLRGLTYSRFMHALSSQGVAVNRKVLADLAVSDPPAFDRLAAVAVAQAAPQPARAEKPPPPTERGAEPPEGKPEAAPPAEAEEAAPKRPKKEAVAKKAKAVRKTGSKKKAAPKPKGKTAAKTGKKAAARKPAPKKTGRSKR